MAPHDNSSSAAIDSSTFELIPISDSACFVMAKDIDAEVHTNEGWAAAHSLTVGSMEQPSSSSIDPPSKHQLLGILRQSPRYSSQCQQRREKSTDPPSADDQQAVSDDDAQPAHWPTLRASIHFIDHTNPSQPLVTSINYRPYTEYSEVSKLYYTSVDFDQFKREYRALLKTQRRRKASTTDANSNGVLTKNSSIWRSKVHGSVHDSSNDSSYQHEEKDHCSTSSSAGIFSSVFDVAKEAVAIFSGSSNFSYYQNQQTSPANKARQQQQLLVDTLYSNLF
jgi:hypothetical protein